MDVSLIQEFVTLAETKKYSAAAARLHISQSALTRHIQAAEQELGCTLFTRTTREVSLSEYGEIYLPYAKKIVNEHRKALNALLAYERDRHAQVNIGVVHNPDLYSVIDYILEFQRLRPDVPVHVTEGTLDELNTEFADGRLNMITMAYASWDQLPEGFVTVGQSRLAAVLPTEHPLARYEAIPLPALASARLIVPETKNMVARFFCQFMEREGIEPDIFYRGNTTGAARLLQERMGVLIQDIERARLQLNDSLTLRELDPEISYVYGLECRKNLSKNERAFVEMVRRGGIDIDKLTEKPPL